MKNIYVLPTDKPSRLTLLNGERLLFSKEDCEVSKHKRCINQHIYITNDEPIKEGDWVYYLHNSGLHKPTIMEVIKPNYSDYKPYSIHFKSGFGVQEDCKKIILTTDQDLIKDGVQPIDDDFLEWLVKNPSCEFVKIEKYFHEVGDTFDYEIIISQQETELEKAAEKYANFWEEMHPQLDWENMTPIEASKIDFIAGAEWQAKTMYTEEDLREAFRQGQDNMEYSEMYGFNSKLTEQEWLEQFKK